MDTHRITGSMDRPEISFAINNRVGISNFLVTESRREVISGIFSGLSADRKSISSRFFYDETGSRLFEEITRLPVYYPTRTEKSILRRVAPEIAASGEPPDIIELGSGDASKISILLDAFPPENLDSVRYYPVDVSEAAILKSAGSLSRRYPGLRIGGLLADFSKHLEVLPGKRRRLICFFGSTLGNFEREQADRFLKELRGSMNPGDSLLLGLDMVKDVKLLEAAYNDPQGITEKFNKNILPVLNGIAKTNFIPRYFEHRACYNRDLERIEMHLEAKREMEIESPCFPEKIRLARGETIHTENSHKYTPGHIAHLESISDLYIKNRYTDPEGWFSLVHFEVP